MIHLRKAARCAVKKLPLAGSASPPGCLTRAGAISVKTSLFAGLHSGKIGNSSLANPQSTRRSINRSDGNCGKAEGIVGRQLWSEQSVLSGCGCSYCPMSSVSQNNVQSQICTLGTPLQKHTQDWVLLIERYKDECRR